MSIRIEDYYSEQPYLAAAASPDTVSEDASTASTEVAVADPQVGVVFTEAQASTFAKQVARDFNPIHDPGSKRFCVPGDLLFAVMLSRHGLAADTRVEFDGMLSAGKVFGLVGDQEGQAGIRDDGDKTILTVEQRGQGYSRRCIDQFCSYRLCAVFRQDLPGYSGAVMREAGRMINPESATGDLQGYVHLPDGRSQRINRATGIGTGKQ